MQAQPVDHRDLIAAYDLGHIQPHSPGLIHWHPQGVLVLDKLQQWILGLHRRYHYRQVRSPMLLSREMWERSGHWDDILSALKDGVSRPKSLKVRTIVEWARVLGQPGRGVHSLFRPLERSELSVF